MTKFHLLILVFIFPLFLNAQKKELNRPKKREFRAVWIATVANIDYPKQPSQKKIAIEEQYKNLLDKYSEVRFAIYSRYDTPSRSYTLFIYYLF